MPQDDEFLESLRAIFRIEAEEHLQAMATGLLRLEQTAVPEEQRRAIEKVFRAAHSLKGAARAVNLKDIESICQSMEDIFAGWQRDESKPAPQVLDAVHRSLDAVTEILGGRISSGSPGSPIAPAEPAPARSEPMTLERSTFGDTVRIAVSKLDARLLEAEEMLVAKLAAGQRAAELRQLAGGFADWSKEWASVQGDVRSLRQLLDRSEQGAALPAGWRRAMEFLEWNHDYLRALEGKIAAFTRIAEQDRQYVGKLVDDLLEDSKKLLMLPLATQGAYFPKLVRDLCRDQGKEAELMLQGEEVEIDKRILEELKDPLTHLLRNCIDHGIETPEERRRQGKPAKATIRLQVSPVNGSKVEILVADDGAGIDAETVRAAAVKRGLISSEEAAGLDDADSLALIFRADVSTSPIITELSGRGLGLAIVREKTEKLGGRVTVESRRHAGTTFRLTLPLALSTFRGILLEVAERLFVVPTSSVERVTRFQSGDVQTVENRETLSLNGRAVSLVRLSDVLEIPPATARKELSAGTPVVILGAGDRQIAFAVDAILDEQEVLVKQLGKPLSRIRNVAGATILGSGRVAVILNVSDLLKSARRFGGTGQAAPAAKPVAPGTKSILVAEDSITSRMLLKGILESAGYRVKIAVDGVEAFAALRAEHFDLVVSDVEMPRMNGFDLTAKIRADKKLADLPLILVTALESREDRERGIDVGANAYLIKSSFDQSNLLEAIRRLV